MVDCEKPRSGHAMGRQHYPQVPDVEYHVFNSPDRSLITGMMVFDPFAAYKSITTIASHPISALERIFQSMPSQIRSIRVAYALNEYRYPYTEIQLRAHLNPSQRTAIVWWPGDHGTIGSRTTQELNISENTFLFMTEELRAAGFRLDEESVVAFRSMQTGERQVLQNSYKPVPYASLGGRNIRKPLPTHYISRMTRQMEEYTMLSEEGMREIVEPVFNPPQVQGNQQEGYFWTTKKRQNHVSECGGPHGDGNDGLMPPRQLTQQDLAREQRSAASRLGGQGRTVGQDTAHDPNVMGIGPNVPFETPHAPTILGSLPGTQSQQQH
ncbi:putative alpha/beta hydrolase domain-containing protein [Cladophialophora immunda]|nr:putative alpha/beta hydrolase domain-containing protein [Cladophialophora immunda]